MVTGAPPYPKSARPVRQRESSKLPERQPTPASVPSSRYFQTEFVRISPSATYTSMGADTFWRPVLSVATAVRVYDADSILDQLSKNGKSTASPILFPFA